MTLSSLHWVVNWPVFTINTMYGRRVVASVQITSVGEFITKTQNRKHLREGIVTLAGYVETLAFHQQATYRRITFRMANAVLAC